MRRKLRVADAAVKAGMLDSVPAEWTSERKPKLIKEIRDYAAFDLAALDDSALFAHVDELSQFYIDCLSYHFHLAIPYAVGLRELAIACEELLGWNLAKSMGLLQGLSLVSCEGTDELAAIGQRARPGSAARQILESRTPDFLERLSTIDSEIADALRNYLAFWGLRPIGNEVGCPLVCEQPQLVADAIADVLAGGKAKDLSAARAALKQEAHARLNGAARQRFDRALEYAERVYPLREDNVVYTDQLPVGLLRLAALEIGRRLVRKGLIGRVEDVVMLTADEAREALAGGRDMRAVVSRRKSEHAWVRANPGPLVYGPPPSKVPDLRGLPAPAQRINAGLLWIMDQEFTAPPPSEGSAIMGTGVSAGVYRGRVRVITSAEHLHTLRQGEVLVCPLTSSAWMMVFRRAGAIVADTGSVLSHTAIVAREFGLPAVVGTINGTSRLNDGDEVIVDGARGTVTRG